MARRGQKQALCGPLTDPLDPPAIDEAPAEAMAGRADVGLIRALRPPPGLRSRRLRMAGDVSATMERTRGESQT